jgi:hypothetical protein
MGGYENGPTNIDVILPGDLERASRVKTKRKTEEIKG